MTEFDAHEAQMLQKHRATTGSELDGPDLHARTEFTCGLCAVFAAALHDRMGWDIVAEYENEEDIAHVWCVNDSGKAVDINGVHPTSWARTPFSEAKPGRIAPYSRSDCDSSSPDTDNEFQWANEIIDAHLELYECDPFPKPIR